MLDQGASSGTILLMIARGFRFKLDPKPEQEDLFRQFAGVCRLVYNLALEQRSTWGRSHRIGYVLQAADLTRLRADFEWIRAVPVACKQQALRDLDKAFAGFFAGRTRYPKPRRKGVSDTFRVPGRDVEVRRLNNKWSAVWLPKIGWVRFRDTRAMFGKLLNVTVSSGSCGWMISFTRETEHEAPANDAPPVGIDRGVANALALSTGEMIVAPTSFDVIERRRRKAQRVLARRKRGSKRYARQRARVAKLHARTGRIRRDWLHKASTSIAERFGAVALEKLRVANMTASARGTTAEPGRNVRQKAGLNRAILSQGWTIFATMLDYKLAERGGRLAFVDAAYTSQTCSECGAVDSRSRESQAVFACQNCGIVLHADTNAAINIERRGSTPLLGVEGLHQRPFEASTRRVSRTPKISSLRGREDVEIGLR